MSASMSVYALPASLESQVPSSTSAGSSASRAVPRSTKRSIEVARSKLLFGKIVRPLPKEMEERYALPLFEEEDSSRSETPFTPEHATKVAQTRREAALNILLKRFVLSIFITHLLS